MMSSTQFQLRQADWPASAEALKQLRETVFIKEQQVPPELEWDGLDETALHLLAETPDGQPIGCARLLPNGQIGRMSVLRSWRNQGVGSAMLRELLQLAEQQGFPACFLHAQTHAVAFYRRFGFHPEGEIFMDAGIPHLSMRLDKED